MNDPLLVTLLAVAAAFVATWLWIRRRQARAALEALLRAPMAPAPSAELGTPAPAWTRADRRYFVLSLVVVAATRLIGIERFPIYFFTDEAANTVLAADFVENGFRDESGEPFPVYFSNTEKLSLSASVYLQILPYVLLGTSVLATRATAALVGLSAAVAVGLILKDAFRIRRAWVGVLLLGIVPAWFLHSRTAFETTLYASLFAWFLFFYLRYRMGKVSAALPAVVFAALAFYSYNTGQAGLVVCIGLLLLVDARHHLSNRRIVLLAGGLAIVLALPYIRFQIEHPGEIARRLQLLDSPLVRADLPVMEKAVRFLKEYATGISPAYWYAPDSGRDLVRHQMKGYGHLLWPTLPLALLGLVIAIRKWRDPAHRVVLIALFAAPIGAAMAGVQVTRALVVVIPVTLLTVVGAAGLVRWMGDRVNAPRQSAAAFVLLSLVAGAMAWDALRNGATWYSDYGWTGMQYGARQVFSATTEYLARHPRSTGWVFPTAWNGSDMLRRFFAPGEGRISLLSLDNFLERRFEALDSALVVLTASDYARVLESGKVTVEGVEEVVLLPDGNPGFYLVRLSYAPEADAIFSAEAAARAARVEEMAGLGGQQVIIRHTPFDRGSLDDLFDGDPSTFVRTAGANPAIVEIEFETPIRLTGLRLTTGHSDMEITIRADPGGGVQPGRYDRGFAGLPRDPTLELILDPPPGPVHRLTIEVRDASGSAASHVHLREIALIE